MKYAVLTLIVCGIILSGGCRRDANQDVYDPCQEVKNTNEPNLPSPAVPKPEKSADSASSPSASIWYTGKIAHTNIEGGFWLLIADNGQKFDPINLPKEFREDGLRVKFQIREKKGVTSFHMVGKIAEIINIQRL